MGDQDKVSKQTNQFMEKVNKQTNQFILKLLTVGMCISVIFIYDKLYMSQFFTLKCFVSENNVLCRRRPCIRWGITSW